MENLTRAQIVRNLATRMFEGPARRFRETFPVGTVVWSDKFKQTYGTTCSGRVYKDLKDEFVTVNNIDGQSGMWGLWSIHQVVPKK